MSVLCDARPSAYNFDKYDWKEKIILKIQDRNKTQCCPYQDLINSHNRLFDKANALKSETLQLSIQLEKLRLEGSVGLKPGDSSSDMRTVTSEQLLTLEQKLLSQQEELTEIHKKRGENAQMIVDLKNALAEKDKLLCLKEEALAESLSVIASLNAEIKMYQANHKELEHLYQLLQDEHQALQLTFTKLEEKLRNTQDENIELVERLKRYKCKDAEKMNEENENFLRKRNAEIQKELADATKDTKLLSPDSVRDSSSPCNIGSNMIPAIPTRVYMHFDAHDSEVNAVKWSPVDRLIATGGLDRKVKLWDTSKGCVENKGTLIGSSAGVMSVDFDNTGGSIIAASNDAACRIWTVNDQRLRHTLTGHCAKVLAAKFLGEHSKVVTGSHDRTLRIWDLRSKACLETIFVGSSCNDLATMDGAGTVFFSGHFDKRIRIWDLRALQKATEIEVQGKVTSLDLSRDRKYFLLSCVRDDTLRIIDLRMNQIIQTLSADGFKVGCDWSRAVFNVDASYVSAGSADGTVFIWNANTAKVEIALRNEHATSVTAVSWHPFTNHLVSVDNSKKSVVWSDV